MNLIRPTLSLALLALLSACGSGDKPGSNPAGSGAAMPPAEVDVITVTAGSTTITQDLPGRLYAVRSAQIRARVEGVIEKRLFDEGSDVTAGTALYRIDARTYEAQAAAAKADLAAAKAVISRYQPLLESRAVSQQEFDTAHARLLQAEATLAKAKLDLENAVPSAPISGRIGRALVTEGALVGRGEATHLATIEQLDPIRVEFTQAYSDMLRLQQAIKTGKQKRADSVKVEMVLEDGSLYPQKGRLQFTDLSVDPNSGAVILRAEFPNQQRELLPGTFVRVRFPQSQFDAAIRVPQRAVQGGNAGQTVMLVNAENQATVQPVKTGPMSGSDFIVLDGLKDGDQVIVNGLQKIHPGAPVKAVPWTPGGALLVPPVAAPAAEKK
jgi:membrane fusion protein (multidrug efflux system)